MNRAGGSHWEVSLWMNDVNINLGCSAGMAGRAGLMPVRSWVVAPPPRRLIIGYKSKLRKCPLVEISSTRQQRIEKKGWGRWVGWHFGEREIEREKAGNNFEPLPSQPFSRCPDQSLECI
ncbi:hypothetical protein ACE6H2_008738 [Prunus campanulata]